MTKREQDAAERLIVALQELPDDGLQETQLKAKKQILRLLQVVKEDRELSEEDAVEGQEAIEAYKGLRTAVELSYLAGAIAVWNFDCGPWERRSQEQSENEQKHVAVLQELPIISGPFVTLQLLKIIAELRRLTPLERLAAAGIGVKE